MGNGNGNGGAKASESSGLADRGSMKGKDVALEQARIDLEKRAKNLEIFARGAKEAGIASADALAAHAKIIREAANTLDELSRKLSGKAGLAIAAAATLLSAFGGASDAEAAASAIDTTYEEIKALYGQDVADKLKNYTQAYSASARDPSSKAEIPGWLDAIFKLLAVVDPLNIDSVADGTLPPGYPLASEALEMGIDLSPIDEGLGEIQNELESIKLPNRSELENLRTDLQTKKSALEGKKNADPDAYARVQVAVDDALTSLDASIEAIDESLEELEGAEERIASMQESAGESADDPSADIEAAVDALAEGIIGNINTAIGRYYKGKASAYAFNGQEADPRDPAPPAVWRTASAEKAATPSNSVA